MRLLVLSSLVLQSHQHPPKGSRAVPVWLSAGRLQGGQWGGIFGFFSSSCEVLQPPGVYSWLWDRLSAVNCREGCEPSPAEIGTSFGGWDHCQGTLCLHSHCTCVTLALVTAVQPWHGAGAHGPTPNTELFQGNPQGVMQSEPGQPYLGLCPCLGSLPLGALPFLSPVLLQPCLPAACSCSHPRALLGRTEWEWSRRAPAGLVMHSWICSSGRCEQQGSANNRSGCKAAGVQMAALVSCALHCRDWQNVSD